MRIQIVTPASRLSRKGNWTTAARWVKFCRQLGYKADAFQSFRQNSSDVLIALHARKSAKAIDLAASQGLKTVLMLTGTDIYNRYDKGSVVWNSIKRADRLVVLQSEALDAIPKQFRAKTDVIYQSAVPSRSSIVKLKTVFELCCVGHLRPVKDPFRAVFATRKLPAESRIRVVHYGAALSSSMGTTAEKYTEQSLRYRWVGAVPRGKVLARIARSRALIVSSKLEGGSGVITEAVAAGTPVLASRVSGNVGLLGRNYAGFFEYRNTNQLATLMRRCEIDPEFYSNLQTQIKKRKPLVDPQREKKSIERLIRSL